MRYLYLLFFCFLSLHSYLVFAQDHPPLDPAQGCTQWHSYSGAIPIFQTQYNSAKNQCTSSATVNLISEIQYQGGSGSTVKSIRCYNCTDPCPPPSVYDAFLKKCTKQFCPDGSPMPLEGCGGDDGGGDDDSCPSDYPKVNGQCPVCPEYNSDGTCATPSSEPASSAPNSSSPDSGSSGSAGSAGSAGGDDGGGTPGGGGDGSGGNNGGAGSASAASASSASGTNNSWNPYSGYGNWIPVAADSNCPNKYKDMSGQWWCAGGAGNTSSGNTGSAGSAASAAALECDPTASTYFSCINQKSVNGGAGWNPHASYGGWLPINEDSPCVNKFQDKAGDWWCAAPSGGGGGGGGTTVSSAGSSGSSGSDGASGSEGSASSKSSASSSHSSCASASAAPNGSSASNPCSGGGNGSASSSGSVSSLGEKGEFDGEASEKRLEELGEELTEKIDEIKLEIQNEFTSTIQGSGSIEDFCKQIRGQEVCFGMKKFEEWLNPISSAIFLVACVISFSIVLSGRT